MSACGFSALCAALPRFLIREGQAKLVGQAFVK